MFSRVEIFENGDLSYLCEWTSTEIFKCDVVMPGLQALRIQNATCVSSLFNTEKIISRENFGFRKYPSMCE